MSARYVQRGAGMLLAFIVVELLLGSRDGGRGVSKYRAAAQSLSTLPPTTFAPISPSIKVPSKIVSLAPSVVPITDTTFVKYRTPATHFAYARYHDHEEAGILTNGGGLITGVYALHAVYQPGQFKLVAPESSTTRQILFAPTTRPPNGSCLEMGTAYETPVGGATTANVYVYDFCRTPGRFVVETPVSQDFLETYAAARIGDQAAYGVSIYSPAKKIGPDMTWYAQLYNYKAQQWDTIWQSQGYFKSDLRGWSIFEAWYNRGQCSKSLPPIRAASISYHYADNDKWDAIRPTMPSIAFYDHFGLDCFHNNPKSYVYDAPVDGGLHNAWEVVSTGQ